MHVRVYKYICGFKITSASVSKFFSHQTVKLARFELFTVVLMKIQVMLVAALSLGKWFTCSEGL
jgi:hypothetical protein